MRYTAADVPRPPGIMRLDKYLAHTTDLSRKQAKRLIKAGAVRVNETVMSDAGADIPAEADVCVGDEALRRPGYRYFMLNKPQGYICANRDRAHLLAIELLDEDNREQLHFAGRLDIDATGLVLITDDGQWSQRIRSPRHHCEKTYYVEVDEPIPDQAERRFAQGLFLHHDKRRTRPARLQRLDEHSARVRLTEGRYHQVKRMFAALGCTVEVLHRECVGDVALDPELAEGEYRVLTSAEIDALA